MTGSSHERRGTPCQDWQRSVLAPNDAAIIAVSDGAGSASASDIGAFVAVTTAVSVAETLWSMHRSSPPDAESIVRESIRAARRSVQREASSLHVSPSALSCTLILAIVTPDGVTAGQIGDGAVVVSIDGSLTALTKPMRGEFANETTFLTSKGALDSLQVETCRGTSPCIAAFTDGVQDLALNSDGTPHPAFFRPVFDSHERAQSRQEFIADMRHFLMSERVRERSDDDMTLVVAAYCGDGEAAEVV